MIRTHWHQTSRHTIEPNGCLIHSRIDRCGIVNQRIGPYKLFIWSAVVVVVYKVNETIAIQITSYPVRAIRDKHRISWKVIVNNTNVSQLKTRCSTQHSGRQRERHRFTCTNFSLICFLLYVDVKTHVIRRIRICHCGTIRSSSYINRLCNYSTCIRVLATNSRCRCRTGCRSASCQRRYDAYLTLLIIRNHKVCQVQCTCVCDHVSPRYRWYRRVGYQDNYSLVEGICILTIGCFFNINRCSLIDLDGFIILIIFCWDVVIRRRILVITIIRCDLCFIGQTKTLETRSNLCNYPECYTGPFYKRRNGVSSIAIINYVWAQSVKTCDR